MFVVWLMSTVEPPEAIVVKASGGLVPFARIQGPDVEVVRRPSHPGSALKKSDVVGRFSVKLINAGEIVDKASLSVAASLPDIDWTGMRTISITVKPLPKPT